MKSKGRYRMLALAAATLLAGASALAADSDNPAVLFQSDFESGVLNNSLKERPSQGWAGLGNMPEIATDRVRSGRYAMKAYLNKNTSPVRYRTMLQSKWKTTSDARYAAEHNVPFFQDSWIGFSVFLPRSGPGNWSTASRTYETIAQWHDAHFSPIPSWDVEHSKNPVFAMWVSNASSNNPGRDWVISYLGDSRTPYPAIGTPRPFLYESFKKANLGSIEADLDKWTDWVIRIRWNFWRVGSTNNQGSPKANPNSAPSLK